MLMRCARLQQVTQPNQIAFLGGTVWVSWPKQTRTVAKEESAEEEESEWVEVAATKLLNLTIFIYWQILCATFQQLVYLPLQKLWLLLVSMNIGAIILSVKLGILLSFHGRRQLHVLVLAYMYKRIVEFKFFYAISSITVLNI